MIINFQNIDELPLDTMIVHKILKKLLTRFETFIRILKAKKVISTLVSLASILHIEETKINLLSNPHEEALVFRIKYALEN